MIQGATQKINRFRHK